MAESTKLVPFFQKINEKILFNWKESMTQNDSIRNRLEESLKDNMEKHKDDKK